MPVAVTFQEPDTFTVCASGHVTFQECHVMQADLLADPHLRKGVRVLIDACAVDDVPTTSELRTLATEMQFMVERGLGPVAVVTNNTCVYGVVRMFSVFAEFVNALVMPFRDMGEAERWLEDQSSEQPSPS